MPDQIEPVPTRVATSALVVPNFQLPPFRHEFGLISSEEIFTGMENFLSEVIDTNTTPDSADAITVLDERGEIATLRKTTKEASERDPYKYPRIETYALEAHAAHVSFNLLTLNSKHLELRSRDGGRSYMTHHGYATADTDPWSLSNGFNIFATAGFFFGPEHNEIEAFYKRSQAVLHLFGVRNPSEEADVYYD